MRMLAAALAFFCMLCIAFIPRTTSDSVPINTRQFFFVYSDAMPMLIRLSTSDTATPATRIRHRASYTQQRSRYGIPLGHFRDMVDVVEHKLVYIAERDGEVQAISRLWPGISPQQIEANGELKLVAGDALRLLVQNGSCTTLHFHYGKIFWGILALMLGAVCVFALVTAVRAAVGVRRLVGGRCAQCGFDLSRTGDCFECGVRFELSVPNTLSMPRTPSEALTPSLSVVGAKNPVAGPTPPSSSGDADHQPSEPR